MRRRLNGFIVGTLLVTLLTGTAVFAADSTAKDTAGPVTAEEAATLALKDAAVKETDAAVYKLVWEYSDNTEKYDIGFLIPGQTKYEYEIEASTGKILENDKEAWEADDDAEYKGLTAGKTADPEAVQKGLDAALETALKDAGMKAADVTVCKKGTDYENGKEVYVVDFIQEGKAKYEYDIAVADGTIVTHETDQWEKDDDLEYKGLLHPETVTEKKAEETTGGITKEKAQEIALKDAGLAEKDVKVNKCRIDVDNGVEKYEVEFRTADGVEYEYEIAVTDGKILDKDVERDDD